ncbi:hypothetical protein [Amycolatopsis sp. DG1A-15b]|uniref:hypothetical protein n=1 Tax=Amycolatopsis sp. DG1A-15b TaxID=3052846 RepID=UPI00255B7E1F|nr:hypothetical protein [Amycolatopsis sp. DG1A-15b]WIX92510.1 hypothetical protein QRY02_19550 [Amycolatopsis sp. DG1A-15b]
MNWSSIAEPGDFVVDDGAVDASEIASTPKRSDMSSLWVRLKTFLAILIGLVIDSVFFAAWIGLHSAAEALYEQLGHLEGFELACANVIRYSFEGAALVLVLSYVASELYGWIRRIWEEK